uniref:Uncharacterized protein n=1 Tax=Amphimedon queenslandica TaxID=400682 RepID=A0A1X7SYR8_AMPQE
MCRHDLPIKMLNLKHGERLGYADFILKDFEHISSSPVNLLYDVGCKLVLHWKANNHTSLLSNYNVSVPIFHSYAHIASCQAKYSPRNKEGFGLCDGENLERLWSYLGKFCKMTKEMSIANRVDVLTDALNHFSRQKITRLCISFVERMDIASKAVLDKCYFWPTNKSRNNASHGTTLKIICNACDLKCTLSTIEGEHQIVGRWTPDCHEYMEVIAAKKISAREKDAKNKPIEL